MFPTREATTFLNEVLHLPTTGREQDWDIELADPDRAGEFVAYLESHVLSKEQKFALMALIMGSLEDLSYKEGVSPELWDRVKHLLQADPALYADLVRQWGPKNNDPDDFAISKLVQSL